jgi:hypothetical protein
MSAFEDIRPSVIIYCESPETNYNELKLIKEGLEEEGVPVEIKISKDIVESLAINAARESRLGVGIGLSADGMCHLQHRRMLPGNPIMKIHFGIQDKNCYRLLGCNAARLAKIIPLKWM